MPIVIRSGRDLIFFLLNCRGAGGATSTTYNLHTGLNWHTVDAADAAVTGSILSGLTSTVGRIAHGRVNGEQGWVLAGGNFSQDVEKVFSTTSRIPSATTFNLSSPDINPSGVVRFVHYSETYNKWFAGGDGGMTLTSTDGVNWTETKPDFTNQRLVNFASDGNGTWMVATMDQLGQPGTNNGVWRSTNGGSSWTQVLVTTSSAKHISHAGGTWVQAGDGTLRVSTNAGDTWSAGATFAGSRLPPVGDGNGNWAYSNVASQRYRISHSTDNGATWSISAYNLGLDSADGEGALGYFEDKWLFVSKQFGVYRWDGAITADVKTQLLEGSDTPGSPFISNPNTGGKINALGGSFG